ncbi:MAG: FAD-dependent thymidylate synthase [Candidatus Saelkia tenebricola]|nr:FAD-dependent thymidylate synthase [Candidatus Saelkia tenebricola]
MKIYLAGYNVDAGVLDELNENRGGREDFTPEVISAAYARISRDPRAINEIRVDARGEVERARRSNSSIIFKMGHHSVAEHAVFNLDILGVSRFAMEELEKFRLCSYTEKSQRYITLEDDFVIPEEIKQTSLEDVFVDMIHRQNNAYFKLFEKLKEHVFKKHVDLARDPKNHSLLEGWAKEDARYITSLATESQVGQTINARNLELLLRRFASHDLAEIRQLGRAMYKCVANVAPSVIIFHEANDLDSKTFSELKKFAREMIDPGSQPITDDSGEGVRLVEFTEKGDQIIAASLLHVASRLPYERCKSIVKNLSEDKQEDIFKTTWSNMQFYDSMPREFEYVNLSFNIILSAACFGQLKRHRMSTITAQPYDIKLGLTIPESIKEIGMDKYFQEIVDQTNDVYSKIKSENPQAAPYVLTNSHRKRVLIRLNARELYHVSRLREDAHAQWDIQNISCVMSSQAKQVMPLTFALIGGKDKYNEIYKNIFGHLPKITKAILPGARNIK